MIKIMQFDLGDCPYQMNTYIEKNKIRKVQIMGFSHSEKTIIMYYRPD